MSFECINWTIPYKKCSNLVEYCNIHYKDEADWCKCMMLECNSNISQWSLTNIIVVSVLGCLVFLCCIYFVYFSNIPYKYFNPNETTPLIEVTNENDKL